MAVMLDSIQLDEHADLAGDQLEWTDEFEWDAVAQEQERSLAGNMIVQEGIKIHGRSITLASNGAAWFMLSLVRQLEVLRDQPGRVMPLTLADGREFHVIFNRIGGAALDAKPLERQVNPGPDALYELTIRLLTVAPPVTP
ncbi:hypothetical protein [Pseudomonas sp. XK-1]|uniref:hypothetical protein n=1 Tax=Pseudomonas sp. XK-1 TaxID=3136019 RepID=UPI00311A552D